MRAYLCAANSQIFMQYRISWKRDILRPLRFNAAIDWARAPIGRAAAVCTETVLFPENDSGKYAVCTAPTTGHRVQVDRRC